MNMFSGGRIVIVKYYTLILIGLSGKLPTENGVQNSWQKVL